MSAWDGIAGWIDMTHASPDDRELLLGRDFRNISVARAAFAPQQLTEIVLGGEAMTLAGDPTLALMTFLAGRGGHEATA
jgi:hypothetical protein